MAIEKSNVDVGELRRRWARQDLTHDRPADHASVLAPFLIIERHREPALPPMWVAAIDLRPLRRMVPIMPECQQGGTFGSPLSIPRENLESCGISLHMKPIGKEPSNWFAREPASGGPNLFFEAVRDGSRNAKPHVKTKQHIPSPKLRLVRDKCLRAFCQLRLFR
jgi:hypothetical protein